MVLRSACALSHPRFGTDARFVEMLASQAQAIEKELLRLQAENVRLQGSLEAQRLISDRAIALAKELEASKNASIHKLEMDALDLASENSILKRQEQAELEARKPLPLSDEQIDAIADGMPGGLGGFMKTWGWRQFARKILDLRAPPIWEPQFDCMAPGQEELAVQFCAEIAGPRGQPGRNPDPVRLLEMAEALYKAEADAHGITASPAPLIASREVVADGPVRVTRLHLTAGGRAGLTSKAAGPLPGITGGSS